VEGLVIKLERNIARSDGIELESGFSSSTIRRISGGIVSFERNKISIYKGLFDRW
jgi:hypothetical protein